jgi:hypothetical protein
VTPQHSSRVLTNHLAVIDSFRAIYGTNANITSSSVVAIGPHAEDVYCTGNPWYLSVNAAAEQLYYALARWRESGDITVTSISVSFLQCAMAETRKTGNFSSIRHVVIVKLMPTGPLNVSQKYTPASDTFSAVGQEQTLIRLGRE